MPHLNGHPARRPCLEFLSLLKVAFSSGSVAVVEARIQFKLYTRPLSAVLPHLQLERLPAVEKFSQHPRLLHLLSGQAVQLVSSTWSDAVVGRGVTFLRFDVLLHFVEVFFEAVEVHHVRVFPDATLAVHGLLPVQSLVYEVHEARTQDGFLLNFIGPRDGTPRSHGLDNLLFWRVMMRR